MLYHSELFEIAGFYVAFLRQDRNAKSSKVIEFFKSFSRNVSVYAATSVSIIFFLITSMEVHKKCGS